ncbi:hypothetical protein ColLi_02013 [Colletotrichum liriopes]|uniref:Uncharacterized protein n=1 Tax=Colletotrichum liriopes TaxID=708192 RepID=A0AA37GE11_9PEZI|nr:hypothetical protein ColLi_02013 [Colletotrichum liriopes]
MASLEGKPAGVELLTNEARTEPASEIPQPLRVLKRFGCGPRGFGRGAESPRRTSAETDESLGSVPEPPDEPLVVMKKRGYQGARLTPGLTEVNQQPAFPDSVPRANREF